MTLSASTVRGGSPRPDTPSSGRGDPASLQERTVRPATAQRLLGAVALCIGLAAVLSALLCASAAIGTRMLSLAEVWEALTAFDPTRDTHLLVVHSRLPRAVLAVLVGAALGAAGVIMQALSRNPIAEPGLLGVNAGAAVAVAFAIAVLGLGSPVAYLAFALAGAAIAGCAVMLLGGARRGTDPIRLVLAGAALAVVLGALAQILVVNADDMLFDRYRNWMVGSLQGRGVDVLLPVAGMVVIGLCIAAALTRSLDAAALGPVLANTLGARPARVWTLAGLAVVLLAGAATAAAGPIVFVGLTAPHVARAIVGVRHGVLLPLSAGIAAALVLLADVLGRVVAPPGEVGVGIMVALIGGPFFVLLVRRKRLAML